MIAGTAAVGWTATKIREDIALFGTMACLAIAIPLHLIGKRLKSNRFRVYDRQNGTIRREYGWFKLKYHETPFGECEGYLVSAQNQMGLIRHMLMLVHPSLGSFLLTEGTDLDISLGFWSFVIQYMDKNKPLPDIQLLEEYPNREPGLGEWSIWKKKMGTFQIDDPYSLWLKELEQHPELDAGNFGCDTARHNQLSFVIVATAFLVTAITITSITALIVVLTDSR